MNAERCQKLVADWRKEAASAQAFADGGGMNRAMGREFADRAVTLNRCARQLAAALNPEPSHDPA